MSTRTSAADANYLSVSQNIAFYTLGQAVALPNPLVVTPSNPGDYDAVLKISDGTSGLVLTDMLVSQGMEAAVDINNRVSDVSLKGRFGDGAIQGDQVLTVKGGSHDITFAGIMLSRGHKWEIRYGDWSDECFDLSYNIDTSRLIHVDTKPIRLVVGRAKWPTKAQLGPNVRILFWRSVGEKAYWWGKWVLVKAGIL